MNIDYGNTLIIFGSSPYINIIKDKISKIQKKWQTLGLNVFPAFYGNVNYWLWCDTNAFTSYIIEHYKPDKHKLIAEESVYKNEIKKFNIAPYKIFKATRKFFKHQKENEYFVYKTSVHLAINFAIKEGFKNVVLIGVDLTTDWKHFYEKNKVRGANKIASMRQYLYDFKKYINIYKVNPDSDLQLEKLDLNYLIN